MTEEKITIKEINISIKEKEFYIPKNKGDIRDKKLAQKQEFINSNCVYKVLERDLYDEIRYEIKYYYGYIEFLPTSTDSATLTLEIKMDSGLLKLVESLCLENVIEACDKQTQLFKEIFKESVKDGHMEMQNKINKSFLSLPFFNKN